MNKLYDGGLVLAIIIGVIAWGGAKWVDENHATDAEIRAIVSEEVQETVPPMIEEAKRGKRWL